MPPNMLDCFFRKHQAFLGAFFGAHLIQKPLLRLGVRWQTWPSGPAFSVGSCSEASPNCWSTHSQSASFTWNNLSRQRFCQRISEKVWNNDNTLKFTHILFTSRQRNHPHIMDRLPFAASFFPCYYCCALPQEHYDVSMPTPPRF